MLSRGSIATVAAQQQNNGVSMGVENEDDFWENAGDIIDQMVAEHAKERQTQDTLKSQGDTQVDPQRDLWVGKHRELDKPPNEGVLRAANGGNGAPAPHGMDDHGVRTDGSVQSLLAERDGTISLLRDKLNKSEHENQLWKRRARDLENAASSGAVGQGGPGAAMMHKSQAFHLEQQLQNMRQQLAFKDEELEESRRLRLQREEYTQRVEEEKAAVELRLKGYEARGATAEAEMLLRSTSNANCAPTLLRSPQKLSSPRAGAEKDQGASKARVVATRGSAGASTSGMVAVAAVAHRGGGWSSTQVGRAGSIVGGAAGEILGAVTSHLRSRDAAEAAVAAAVSSCVSADRDLAAMASALVDFVCHRLEGFSSNPGAFRRAYLLGKGDSCVDHSSRLLVRIARTDQRARRVVAARDESISALVALAGCSSSSSSSACLETAAEALDLAAMAATLSPGRSGNRLASHLRHVVSDADPLGCLSPRRGRVLLSAQSLVYRILEHDEAVAVALASDATQASLCRFLDRCLDEGGAEGRQALSILVALYRRCLLSCAVGGGGGGEGECDNMDEDSGLLAQAVVTRLGRVTCAALKMLDRASSALCSPAIDIGDADGRLLECLDCLELLRTLLVCDPANGALVLTGALGQQGVARRFHSSVGLLCQACPIVGLLEDRSWDQVQAPRVLIPTLHRPSWSGGMAKPAKAMYDLASWVYHQVAYLQDEGD